MSVIEHTLTWIRGEIVEHTAVGIFGLSIVALAGLFWRFGSVPTARGLVLPFVLVGALFVVLGAGGIYANTQRVAAYQQRHAEDPAAFVRAETARTEGFLTWYPYTLGSASILIVAGLALFNLASGPTARGTSLALILVGFGGLMIDNVSESNAKRYRAALANQSEGTGDEPARPRAE